MGKTVKEVLKKAGSKKQNKGGGARKYGRHKAHCQRYRLENRLEKNKIRKQKKHLKKLQKKQAKLIKQNRSSLLIMLTRFK